MSHSFTKLWVHAVWSTKSRQPFIDDEIEARIHRVITDEFASAKCNLKIVNGMPDHVHCLFQLDGAQSPSSIIRQVKGGSSHTINQSDWMGVKFSWQTGYSAFSVSESMYWQVFNYIKNQKTHHRSKSSHYEIIALLKAHGIEANLELAAE
jgi:REP element-mobilizing transposase RayT